MDEYREAEAVTLKRIDEDARLLDYIFRKYEVDLQAVVKKVYAMWADSDGILKPEAMFELLTKKEVIQ